MVCGWFAAAPLAGGPPALFALFSPLFVLLHFFHQFRKDKAAQGEREANNAHKSMAWASLLFAEHYGRGRPITHPKEKKSHAPSTTQRESQSNQLLASLAPATIDGFAFLALCWWLSCSSAAHNNLFFLHSLNKARINYWCSRTVIIHFSSIPLNNTNPSNEAKEAFIWLDLVCFSSFFLLSLWAALSGPLIPLLPP